jgi:hypothetical protein
MGYAVLRQIRTLDILILSNTYCDQAARSAGKQNGIDKNYIDPDETMPGIDFLPQLQKRGAKLKGE